MTWSEDKDADGKSWVDMAWLMLSDVLGTAVLTFMAVSTQLGWVLTLIAIVGVFPMSVFISVLMTRTRHMLRDEALQTSMAGHLPTLDSFGAVALCAWKSQCASVSVYLAVYGNTLVGNASYLLVLGRSLQQVFFNTELCLTFTCAIGILFLIVPIFTVRRLDDSIVICFINTLLIGTVIVMGLSSLIIQGRPEDAQSVAFSPKLSILGVFGAVTNVVYSYAGQWMYFELMDIMAEPDDFPKAFTIAGPVMVLGYIIVAMVGYFWTSPCSNCDLVTLMGNGPWKRVAAVLLFLHVIVVYLIKSIVLARYFHSVACPGDLNARTPVSYLKHGAWGCAMLAFGYVVANSVPFFDNLTGLVGGLLAAPVNFLLPVGLYLTARSRWLKLKEEDSEEQGCWASMCTGYCSLPWSEMLFITFIIVFTLCTMFVGVCEQSIEIIEKWSTFGAPFSCQAQVVSVSNVNPCGIFPENSTSTLLIPVAHFQSRMKGPPHCMPYDTGELQPEI